MADALIFGATGGMGQALVDLLQVRGFRVFAAARDVSRIPDTVYRKYEFEAVDRGTLKDLAIDIALETRGLDLWVYAAGELRAGRIQEMPDPTWTAVIDSNLSGPFMAASQTLQLVRESGQVIFIGAYVEHLVLPQMGAYAAAKAGLEQLVGVMQKEHRKLNFTLVKPGAVKTDFWLNAPFRMPADAKSAEDIAQAIMKQYDSGGRGVLAL